ncbi:MAG: hypothetical protein HAW59_02220 [Betaproteobacteria bacterium]|nr:hypothetical protein [Betaproteobacteria bacterium]
MASVMFARYKHNWGAVMSPPQGEPNTITGKARTLKNAPTVKKQPL